MLINTLLEKVILVGEFGLVAKNPFFAGMGKRIVLHLLLRVLFRMLLYGIQTPHSPTPPLVSIPLNKKLRQQNDPLMAPNQVANPSDNLVNINTIIFYG